MGVPIDNFTLLQTVEPTEAARLLSPVKSKQSDQLPPEF